MSSTVKKFDSNRICLLLQAEEKSRRKLALDEILKTIFNEEASWTPEEILNFWEDLNRSLARLLNDEAEICRDHAIEIIKRFLTVIPPDEKHVVFVIPSLARRLGCQELIETSEEVRLCCVIFLKIIIPRYKDHLSLYIDDLVYILAKTVTDNYPSVKRESCESISELAKTLPAKFYARSVNFIKPILSNFSHQHYKVRSIAVKTIGDVLLYGDSKSVEDVTTPLAERLFDQSGVVREAVIEVAGIWLVKLKDRYSWWYKLLPLLLTGLHDEIEKIRIKAAELWDQTGQQYLKENENDERLKDKIDFLTDEPTHYPSNIIRPNLGCRVIAQQNLCKLVKAIGAELGDWLSDIRVRSAQLLCVLILNVEEDVTQHIEKLLPPMYRAGNDEDNRVVENIQIAAKYIGYFVQPKIYIDLILPTLDASLTVGHLRIFSAILRGTQRTALVEYLVQIANFLHNPNICQNKKSKYQKQILCCCDSLLSICKEDCSIISQELFTVIFTTLSMANEKEIQNEARKLLITLANINNFTSLKDLYSQHLRPLLITAHNSCESWSVYSADSQIFRGCLIHAAFIIANNMDMVLPILEKTMNSNADPELKLKHFILLSDYFINNRDSFHQINNLNIFIHSILDQCIIPGLVWSAGRSAEAIRTAAICCFCALFENNAPLPNENKNEIECVDNQSVFATSDDFQELFKKISPFLVTLAEDNTKRARLYALKAIYLVMEIGHKNNTISAEHIHKVYPVVLKRLDDACDDVRCTAAEALVEIWSSLPKDYDLVCSKCHVDMIYTTMIIHLDDPEPKFQELMLEALIKVAHVHPELLHHKLQNCKTNFRNQEGIQKLISHCQNILANS
ncbi:dynein axonemal assembly factor 5 [Prorops nasuta]|uniref:dynein axonemal assembly factor 5 n=1 Tax=Prorops nasuta TaxID=863751 RepID=UPI0034CDDCBB